MFTGESLVFHGAIILLAGFFSGYQMGKSVNKKMDDRIINSWRVAHSGLVSGGMMMIMVALIIPHFVIHEMLVSILVLLFIISGYSFLLALVLGPYAGYRGLKPKPYGINTVVYAGNMAGSLSSAMGVLILLYISL